MQHTCLQCDHDFWSPGQTDGVQPAAQCPNCQGYRTQPGGIPDEQNDMVHGIGAMPGMDQQDDMSGNPLREGILGDDGWKSRGVRDESFNSSVRISLFETPEFETTGIVAPPDLYRHGMETEAAHRADIQLPEGITDNLHATLGNLQAWVENPYENGQLRPYYNKYWKVIRPKFMKPGALQIGVADPTMAEIINHVAQTDDLTPLYQYRGQSRQAGILGDLGGAVGLGLLNLIPGVGEAADATLGPALLGDVAGTAATTGLTDTGMAVIDADAGGAAATIPAQGPAGVMGRLKGMLPGGSVAGGAGFEVGKNLMGQGINYADDLLGMGGGQGGMGGAGTPIQDTSFYSRLSNDEDDAQPSVHGEIPKQDDGDYHQQDDGNHHEWQRDISVNSVGGTDHSPSFDSAGPGMQRFVQMLPLIMQYIESGEDASQDPLIQGLHETLEGELPGYLGHGDHGAADQLIMMVKPHLNGGTPKAEPTHADENSGGKHESRTASLRGYSLEFLPDLEVLLPDLYRHTAAPMMPPGPMGMAPGMGAPPPPSPMSAPSPMPATPGAPDDSSQGPVTDEQQSWFAKWLQDHGREDEIPKMIANPQLYAKDFAQARGREAPPQNTEDAGMSTNPPAPAQESAPPEATMPMPGMSQQMMSAVQRYAADSVATKCPACGSHTTGLLDETGASQCHACGKTFTTKGKHPNKIDDTTSSWHVAEAGDFGGEEPIQGVPIADQQGQRDLREEQDSGHTWVDKTGAPLKVGQEYEMYSDKYDIPDLIRIEAVKPNAIVYMITGEYGLHHSTELSREEANIEGTTFKSIAHDRELGAGDESLEENNDNNSVYTGEPERTDASAPTGLVAASVNPRLAWLEPETFRTAGANFTPMEQRALIDESGSARNSNLLDLVGTHYVTDADEDQFLFGY